MIQGGRNTIRGLVLALLIVSRLRGAQSRSKLTLDLLEPLLVKLRDLLVLLLQDLETFDQGVCDLQTLILGLIFVMCLLTVQRSLHLSDSGNDVVCFFGHLILFGGNQLDLVMEGLG